MLDDLDIIKISICNDVKDFNEKVKMIRIVEYLYKLEVEITKNALCKVMKEYQRMGNRTVIKYLNRLVDKGIVELRRDEEDNRTKYYRISTSKAQ